MDSMHTDTVQLVIPGYAARVCQVCKAQVPTYIPTGTNRVFARQHDITPGYRCSGSAMYTIWSEGI